MKPFRDCSGSDTPIFESLSEFSTGKLATAARSRIERPVSKTMPKQQWLEQFQSTLQQRLRILAHISVSQSFLI